MSNTSSLASKKSLVLITVFVSLENGTPTVIGRAAKRKRKPNAEEFVRWLSTVCIEIGRKK